MHHDYQNQVSFSQEVVTFDIPQLFQCKVHSDKLVCKNIHHEHFVVAFG